MIGRGVISAFFIERREVLARRLLHISTCIQFESTIKACISLALNRMSKNINDFGNMTKASSDYSLYFLGIMI
ncbi:MAG: hypothetical protein ACE3JK_17340 [Sporolactobacillus sp.]